MEKPQGRLNAASSSSSAPSPTSSFASLRSYGRALAQTHRRLRRRAGSVTTTYEEMSRVRARSGADMDRSLRWLDLVGLGIGGMVGAGVFVATGRAAKLYAGPAIVLSYAIAGLCALLSAFCYTEFAVDMPVAGGAFSYLRVTFGEFAAFLTGANLIMEYVFSNAAVARSFTAYLGSAIGVDTTAKCRFTVAGLPEGFDQIDLLAVAVILLISICICYSTKESSVLNMALTTIHIAFILFIIVVGFWRGHVRNLTHPANPTVSPGGFLPYGAAGVFNGAAMVYLSYIGYDAVSTMAEEVRHPAHDIPIGVSGSVAVVTLLYCLMAVSMSMLVPYDAIDTESPFSAAFDETAGWGWVSKVIGAGASFGILTSLLVAMLGQARYLCVIGRSRVVHPWLAKVNPKTCTPVNASAFLVSRSYYGGDRSLHRSERPPQPRLHRHPLRLLHGRQRRHLPPVRRRRLHRPSADRLLPARLLRRLPRLHAVMEAHSGGRDQGGAPRQLRRSGRHLAAGVPVRGARSEEAGALGGAANAVDSGRLHFPQRLPAGVAGRPIVLAVCRLLGLRRACLRLLQCAFQL
ncbi:cationic amino acid transporter 7, chloroplastic-like isoform X2 [Curcuma longa]|uniref:cationic amino acid transporter 7, chloroplastic-like isoform X2 n=1 Tax=Curcuma longa TaxID=136217 RepID=UPI003D9F4F7C